jgi:hypothetical protein
VVRAKNTRNVVKNNYGEFMKEEDLDQIITGLLVRISSLESLLISGGVISKDDYTNELSLRIREIQEALVKVKDVSFDNEEVRKTDKRLS